jgi:hypothetical protein
MLQNKVQKKSNVFAKDSLLNGSFLTIFFYFPPKRREKLENLIQFFQQHNITVERIQNKKSLGSLSEVVKSANFIAQSCHSLSKSEFEYLSQFLISNVIVVAFFYQQQICSVLRLQKLNTDPTFLRPCVESSVVCNNPFYVS